MMRYPRPAAIARHSSKHWWQHCKWVRLFAHFRTAFFRRYLRHAAIARLSHKHCSPIRKHAFQETQALLPFLAFLTSADGSFVSDRVAFFRRDLRHAAIALLSHKHGSPIRRHSSQETQALLPFLVFSTSTHATAFTISGAVFLVALSHLFDVTKLVSWSRNYGILVSQHRNYDLFG